MHPGKYQCQVEGLGPGVDFTDVGFGINTNWE